MLLYLFLALCAVLVYAVVRLFLFWRRLVKENFFFSVTAATTSSSASASEIDDPETIALPDDDEDDGAPTPTSYAKENLKREHYDVIYIGSGISALSGASVTSQHGNGKNGKLKILILEQSDALGGQCHSWQEDGFEFCGGVHYLIENPIFTAVLRKIAEGKVQLTPLAPRTHIGARYSFFDPETNAKLVNMNAPEGIEAVIEEEIVQFAKDRPDLEDAIRQFWKDARQIGGEFTYRMIVKYFVPKCLRGFVIWILGLFGVKFFKFNKIPFSDYLLRLFPNDDASLDGEDGGKKTDQGQLLRSYRNLFSPDTGLPSDVPASAGLMYWDSCGDTLMYPSKGPKHMIDSILRTIRKHGGEMYVNATVKRILLNEDDIAYGVEMENGDVILSEFVVSTCGIRITYDHLLPERVKPENPAFDAVWKHPNAGIYNGAFLGFDQSAEELGFPETPHLCFLRSDHCDWLPVAMNSPSDLPSTPPSVTVLHSSSVHPCGIDGDLGLSIFSFTGPSSFTRWEGTRLKQRGSEYEDEKALALRPAIERLMEEFPKLRDHCVHQSLFTRLTVKSWCGWLDGECLGCRVGFDRASMKMYDECIAKTGGVRGGLVVSGNDSMFLTGVQFSMLSGIISSSIVLKKPYLLLELVIAAEVLEERPQE